MTIARANAAGTAADATERRTAAQVRAEYENSPEYRLGCEIIDELTGQFGLGADEVAAMLSGGTRPPGSEMLGRQAADILERMEKNGQLARRADEYLEDPAFLALLREVPAQVAVRLSDAELSSKRANERVDNERSAGRQEILETLSARRALPRQTRAQITASAEPDFAGMSAEEFNAFRRRFFGHD